MPLSGSVDSVLAAIGDDAAVEAERIEKTAADDTAAQRKAAASVAAGVADHDQRLAAARRRNAETIAQAEWEARRAFIEQRERWIDSVVARGREILRDTPPDALARLKAEALAAVGDPRAAVTAASSGGWIVRAGNLVVDNSLDERSRRFEPVWRAALAEMYRP